MASEFAPLVVGLGGTARAGSSTERALRISLAAAEAAGARTQLFDGPFIASLPLYSPSVGKRTRDEQRLLEAVRASDGLIVGSPGYHGSLSGSVKNALDLFEETAKDTRPYLDGRPFGAVVSAHGWQAASTTLVTLRAIAHALRAWPTPYGATLNASQPMFNDAGDCIDPNVGEQLALVARQVVDFARWKHASDFAQSAQAV